MKRKSKPQTTELFHMMISAEDFAALDKNAQTQIASDVMMTLLENFPIELDTNMKLSILTEVIGAVLALYDCEPDERFHEVFRKGVKSSYEFNVTRIAMSETKGTA